eukprot:503440_1
MDYSEPLLRKMSTIVASNVTKSQLLDIHQQKIQHNGDYSEQKDNLLNILGGIENVITLLLSSNDTEIKKYQLEQIYEAISDDCTSCIDTDQVKEVKQSDSPPEWTYVFRSHTTFLHSLFGRERGQKLFDIMYSKYVTIPFLLFYVISIIILLLPFSWTIGIGMRIFSICFFTLLNIYLLFVILSVNKTAFKLIRNRFEFWFKLFLVIKFTVAGIVWNYHLDTDWLNNQSTEDTMIGFGHSRLIDITIILVCMVMLCVDGLQISIRSKIIGCCATSIIISYLAIRMTVYRLQNATISDTSILYFDQKSGSGISLWGVIVDSFQILSLFFWKQTVAVTMRKNKCALIKYIPYFKWINDSDCNMLQKMVQMSIYNVSVGVNASNTIEK